MTVVEVRCSTDRLQGPMMPEPSGTSAVPINMDSAPEEV